MSCRVVWLFACVGACALRRASIVVSIVVSGATTLNESKSINKPNGAEEEGSKRVRTKRGKERKNITMVIQMFHKSISSKTLST